MWLTVAIILGWVLAAMGLVAAGRALVRAQSIRRRLLDAGSEEPSPAQQQGEPRLLGRWLSLAGYRSPGAVALFVVFIPLTSWIDSQRKEREAFYKAETFRRLAESSSDSAKAALDLLREQSRMETRKKREGMKLGGLINIGVGVGLMIFLRALVHDAPV